jgi:hypothetical protein
MARKRMIDPSIWTDDGMAELSPRQQLLYIGLISNADDHGRLKGNATAIRLILPGVFSEVSNAEIEQDIDMVLEKMSKLKRYHVDSRPYLVFQNYGTWQYIQKPKDSVLPAPISDESGTSTVQVSDSGDTDTEPVTPNRKERKGIEKKGTEPDALARARRVLMANGLTSDEVDRSLDLRPHAKNKLDDLEFMAEHCFEWNRSNRKKIKSPYQTWLSWLNKDKEFSERDGPVNQPPRRPSNFVDENEWDDYFANEMALASAQGVDDDQ